MTQFPLISVIMPCFNSAKTLAASIASVFAQSYPTLELIVVDDGSNDNSLAILKKITNPRLKIFQQSHTGVSVARNKALTEANGSLIAFLDADDSWHPDCLLILFQTLQKQADAKLAYCGWQNIGLSAPQNRPFSPPDYETPEKALRLFENCRWPIHACLTYHSVISEAGGFNHQLTSSEDFLLWLKIAVNHKIVQTPEVLAFYHFHARQTTKNRAQTAINHLKAQQLFIKEHPKYSQQLGLKKLQKIMTAELLKKGFICYWERDLENSRLIFQQTLKFSPFNLNNCKYLLPTLLPLNLYKKLIQLVDKIHE